MSNVIGGVEKERYFQMLDEFVASGDLRDLSGSAVKYYVYLSRLMNKTGQVELELTNKEVFEFAGIKDHNTAKKAREELVAHRRIRTRRGPSGGIIHVMLTTAGEVFPPAKGRRPIRYHVPREKLKVPGEEHEHRAERVARTPQPDSLPEALSTSVITRFCYVHRKETEHWNRNGDFICQACHPRPIPVQQRSINRRLFPSYEGIVPNSPSE